MENLQKKLKAFGQRKNGDFGSLKATIENLRTTLGFMQVGLGLVTSAICKSQLQSNQTNYYQLLFLTSSAVILLGFNSGPGVINSITTAGLKRRLLCQKILNIQTINTLTK
jgi:hypothetical protein